MQFKIKKSFTISYAHRLKGYRGRCGRIHGHTANIEVVCGARHLGENGIGIDFNEIKEKVGSWLNEALDHRLLLEKTDPAGKGLKEMGEDVFLLPFQPSAENLARMIYKKVKEMGFPVEEVTFFESPTSAASYKD